MNYMINIAAFQILIFLNLEFFCLFIIRYYPSDWNNDYQNEEKMNKLNFSFYDSKYKINEFNNDWLKYCGTCSDINGHLICVYYIEIKINFLDLENFGIIKQINFILKSDYVYKLKFYKIKNIDFLIIIEYDEMNLL